MPGGPVDLLSFNFLAGQTGNDQTFNDFKIHVAHTDITSMTLTYEDNYSGNTPELVYSAATMTPSTVRNEWFGWEFDPPFHYDGTSNLIFELTHVNPQGSILIKVADESGRCLFASGVNTATGNILGNDPAMRIYYDPNSGIEDRKNTAANDMKLRLTDSRIIASLPSLVNNKEVSVAIYTMAGKNVCTQNAFAGNNSVACSITKLPAGMYTFAVMAGEVRLMRKFCVMR